MQWTTTDDIVQELDLESAPDNLDTLKKELRIRLATLHPDKSGGSFSSKENEAEYNRVASAYEFVTQASRESHALIPITQLPAIIKAVRDAQLTPAESHISQLHTECRSEMRSQATTRYVLPRIGSGMFAAICVFLFTFSTSFAEHPILGKVGQSLDAQMLLLFLAACSGLFFVLTWVRERNEQAQVELLMSEKGRRDIVRRLLEHVSDPTDPEAPPRFTLRNVVDMIQGESGRRRFSPALLVHELLFGEPHITASVAEKIAQMHVLELEKRNAIHRVEDPSIDSVYQFDERVTATRD